MFSSSPGKEILLQESRLQHCLSSLLFSSASCQLSSSSSSRASHYTTGSPGLLDRQASSSPFSSSFSSVTSSSSPLIAAGSESLKNLQKTAKGHKDDGSSRSSSSRSSRGGVYEVRPSLSKGESASSSFSSVHKKEEEARENQTSFFGCIDTTENSLEDVEMCRGGKGPEKNTGDEKTSASPSSEERVTVFSSDRQDREGRPTERKEKDEKEEAEEEEEKKKKENKTTAGGKRRGTEEREKDDEISFLRISRDKEEKTKSCCEARSREEVSLFTSDTLVGSRDKQKYLEGSRLSRIQTPFTSLLLSDSSSSSSSKKDDTEDDDVILDDAEEKREKKRRNPCSDQPPSTRNSRGKKIGRRQKKAKETKKKTEKGKEKESHEESGNLREKVDDERDDDDDDVHVVFVSSSSSASSSLPAISTSELSTTAGLLSSSEEGREKKEVSGRRKEDEEERREVEEELVISSTSPSVSPRRGGAKGEKALSPARKKRRRRRRDGGDGSMRAQDKKLKNFSSDLVDDQQNSGVNTDNKSMLSAAPVVSSYFSREGNDDKEKDEEEEEKKKQRGRKGENPKGDRCPRRNPYEAGSYRGKPSRVLQEEETLLSSEGLFEIKTIEEVLKEQEEEKKKKSFSNSDAVDNSRVPILIEEGHDEFSPHRHVTSHGDSDPRKKQSSFSSSSFSSSSEKVETSHVKQTENRGENGKARHDERRRKGKKEEERDRCHERETTSGVNVASMSGKSPPSADQQVRPGSTTSSSLSSIPTSFSSFSSLPISSSLTSVPVSTSSFSSSTRIPPSLSSTPFSSSSSVSSIPISSSLSSPPVSSSSSFSSRLHNDSHLSSPASLHHTHRSKDLSEASSIQADAFSLETVSSSSSSLKIKDQSSSSSTLKDGRSNAKMSSLTALPLPPPSSRTSASSRDMTASHSRDVDGCVNIDDEKDRKRDLPDEMKTTTHFCFSPREELLSRLSSSRIKHNLDLQYDWLVSQSLVQSHDVSSTSCSSTLSSRLQQQSAGKPHGEEERNKKEEEERGKDTSRTTSATLTTASDSKVMERGCNSRSESKTEKNREPVSFYGLKSILCGGLLGPEAFKALKEEEKRLMKMKALRLAASRTGPAKSPQGSEEVDQVYGNQQRPPPITLKVRMTERMKMRRRSSCKESRVR